MFEGKGNLSLPKQRLTIAIQLGCQFLGINGMLAFISVIKFEKRNLTLFMSTLQFSVTLPMYGIKHTHTFAYSST